MKRKKRLLSLLFCSVMLLSICPPLVYAETGASFSNTANDTDGLFDHDQEYNIFDGNENEDFGAMQKEPRITPRSTTWEKKLYKDNMWTGGAPNPDTELKDGESVSISDQFIVQYNFILSPEAIENIDSNNNKEYSLSCPDGLEWKTGEDTDIEFESGDKKIKFATLVRKEGKASLIFEDKLKDKAESGIEGIYLYLGCGLNEAMLEEQGQPEEVVIELTDSAIVHVKIVENQPRNSALDEKTGSYNNGLFKWTVRYQPGNKEQNLPLTLVDEFDSLYHDYKEGSICIQKTDGSEYKPDPATLDVLRENGRTLIKCVIPEDISNGTDPVTITYETVLTDAGLTATKNQTVTNSAWLVNSKNMPVGNKITGKVTFQKTEWLKKDSAGSLQYDTNGRYLEWTVTVLTNGKNLDRLILHDKLLSGTDYTSIDENSVTVTAYRGGSGADETNNHTIQMHENNVGYDLTFNKRDADKYEIKYKTYINEKYFQSSVSGQFKNQASLEYGWYPNGGDTGEMFEPDSPIVTKPVNVNGNLIGKSGEGYDPGEHQITWRVTVNPYKLDLSKITTTDNLKDVGQTYVDGSFAVDGGISSVTPDWDVNTGVLTAEFYDTGEKSFSYTFKTIVIEEKDYGYNLARKDYKNTVSANAVLNDSTSNELKSTATAAQNIWSNVLQKEAEGYDYRDHTIGWHITVNNNRMPMQSKDGVLLEDILPVGLRYVENSLSVQKEGADNNAGTADAGQYTWKTTDTDNGQKLTFDYGSGQEFTDKLVLSFRTKVDVDAIDSFQDKTSFDIRNSIVLKRKGYGDLTETADQKISNNILDKKGTYDKSQGTITYTVNLNPHAIELKNITVRDELPKGLQLDKDTVRLYKADAKENGTLEKRDEIILDDILTANVLDGWFEIKLPTGNMSYILQYVTDVTDITQTTFYNKISMKGSASITPPSGGSNVNLGGGGGGGGGTASPKVNLTLDLKDTLRPGVNLEGAVFRIYDGEEPLNEVTTDKEGKAVFRYLKRGKIYRVEQISAPTGYKMIDTPISIEISNDNNVTPKEYKYPALFNQPVTGTLSFTKTNGNERLLEGAEFTLTDKTPESILVKTAISDEGGIVSFMDIPYGEYELEETRAPEYHELNSTVYKVAVNEDGQVSLTDPADFDTLLTEIVNVPQKGILAIAKTDEETDDVLPGVEFTLYTWNDEKNERGDEFAVGETDGNGRLSFDVNLGERYELVETKSLPGYGTAFELKNLFDSIMKTKDGLLLTVYDKDTPLTLDLTNKAHTTDLVFRLVNNRGIPMARTKVWLAELDADGNLTGRQFEAEASSDGTVTFRNVRRNANYSIFTAPIDPDAIIPDISELLMSVTVPADVSEAPTVIRPEGQEDILTEDYLVIGITPAEEQWILTVNIIDSKTKNPLPGATVGLYADESCTILIKNANSSGDGTLSFDGLIKGQKYWIREDIQPGGYKPDGIVHLVEETNPVVSIENMKESDESNYDSGGTTNPNPTDPPPTDSKPTEPEQTETTKPSQKPTEPEQTETTKPSQKPTEPERTETTKLSQKPTEPEQQETIKSSQKTTESAELSGSSKPGIDVPRTGDNSNLTLVFVLLIVSGIGSIMMCLYSRRFGAARIAEIRDTFTEIR